MIPFEEGKQLVFDAFVEFYPEHWQKYISEDDMEKFLRQHKLVKKDTCPKCGADWQVWKEMLHAEHICK